MWLICRDTAHLKIDYIKECIKKVYDYYHEGKDLSLLLTGKVTLEYKDHINSLIKKGLAVPPKHITDAYAVNSNTNKTVDFILRNLK